MAGDGKARCERVDVAFRESLQLNFRRYLYEFRYCNPCQM